MPGFKLIYQKLLPMEQYAQAWSNVWSYNIPRSEQVSAVFTSDLDELTVASKASSGQSRVAVVDWARSAL